jgi:pyruvate dehydrogenase E1 component alpha subunit
MAQAVEQSDLQREHSIELLKGMVRIRRFEEKAAEMYSLGKIRGFLHLYIGEEAVAVGAMQALRPEDNIVATYREHGQALARGIPARVLMAEMYGKATGCSRGHGGSMHFFDKSRRFYGGYAIVGGGLPIAVGLALADKMQNRTGITACFFGDGAVAEGEFHESLNLAALWKLPVLFLCENNLYAMGTELARHQSQVDISAKANGYAIPSDAADGMDVLAVEEAARAASHTVRESGYPFLLELRTYRFRAHSMADPDLYRTKAEVEQWKTRDPIAMFRERIQSSGLLEDGDIKGIESGIQSEIAGAVAYAEAEPLEPISDLAKDVYTTTDNSTTTVGSLASSRGVVAEK